jgi:hypothetical protein
LRKRSEISAPRTFAAPQLIRTRQIDLVKQPSVDPKKTNMWHLRHTYILLSIAGLRFWRIKAHLGMRRTLLARAISPYQELKRESYTDGEEGGRGGGEGSGEVPLSPIITEGLDCITMTPSPP